MGITDIEWKKLATTVKGVAESIISRESPQHRNQSYLSAHTKKLILEAKIYDGKQAKVMRRQFINPSMLTTASMWLNVLNSSDKQMTNTICKKSTKQYIN